MYDDLVKRLRADADYMDSNGIMLFAAAPFYRECADAIEELTGFVQEAERDRDEYRERLERTNELLLNRWIPVTVRLPEDGSDILAVQSCCGEVRIIPANYDRGVWYDCIFNRVAEHITHWMPLPEPPKEEV